MQDTIRIAYDKRIDDLYARIEVYPYPKEMTMCNQEEYAKLVEALLDRLNEASQEQHLCIAHILSALAKAAASVLVQAETPDETAKMIEFFLNEMMQTTSVIMNQRLREEAATEVPQEEEVIDMPETQGHPKYLH